MRRPGYWPQGRRIEVSCLRMLSVARSSAALTMAANEAPATDLSYCQKTSRMRLLDRQGNICSITITRRLLESSDDLHS